MLTDNINSNKQVRVYDAEGHFLRLSVDEVIARGLNQWKGWSCSAGSKGLYIDYDGNVWNCNQASTQLGVVRRQRIVHFVRQRGVQDPQSAEGEVLLKEFVNTPEANSIPLRLHEGSRYWGFRGTIYEGFDTKPEWVSCPFNACACGADVPLPKIAAGVDGGVLAVATRSYPGRDATSNMERETIGQPAAVECNYEVPRQVLWDLGRRCNYDCSYCWPSIHNRSDEHKPLDLLIQTADQLIQQWADGGPIRWYFGGGEPTIHPQLLEFVEHLRSRGQWVMVTSNGSRDAKYWRRAIRSINSVNLSAHFDHVDEDRFVTNVQTICDFFAIDSGDHWVEVKLMAPPEHFERAVNLRDRIRSLGCVETIGANGRINGALSLVPIRQRADAGKVVEYTPGQIALLQSQ